MSNNGDMNNSKTTTQAMQEPQMIKEHMLKGEIAQCNFCNKFETNAIGAMCNHIECQHFSGAGTEGFLRYVTLTGKTGVIVPESAAQTKTPKQMLADLMNCRLSLYDRGFVNSLFEQYYNRGYLSERQLAALSKLCNRYRKQISANMGVTA